MSGEPVQWRSEGSRSGHRFATYSAVRHTSYLLVASLPIFIHGDPLGTGKKLGRVETSVIVTGNAPARGGGGGYGHIWASWVCAAVKGMVFKQFTARIGLIAFGSRIGYHFSGN